MPRPLDNETMTIMGHVLKAAWCLGRVYQNDPDTNYVNAAEKLILDVWNNGYDHEFGGPYKDYNRVTGQMLMWGNPDTCKAWWQMEQAVTAGLMLYDITGDSIYLQMADESLDFFMKYFVDHTYSEVYADRTRYGSLAWNEYKGSNGKAAYHSIELGYYVYLYGNLFLHGNPVTLYYKFDHTDSLRNILLSPLAIADNRLKIQSITKNGNSYSNFNAYERILTIPAGEEGIFEVTYELVDPTYISTKKISSLPQDFVLNQNYPNPFNSTTNIEFYLAEKKDITITIFNAIGQEVTELVSQNLKAGFHNYEWNASGYASGVYFYKLSSGDFVKTKKMLLLK